MADFRRMIPFILHCEAGVPIKYLNKPMEEQFEVARKTGYANDPDDPGGETMVGVILSTYKAYCKSKGYPTPTTAALKKMPFSQWKDILKTMFWDKMKADQIISQGIANMCVDWLWASGPGKIKSIQKILGVTQDGIVGPKTIGAINSANPTKLFADLYNARAQAYRNASGWWKYGKGWMRRLDMINGDGSFTICDKIYKW